MVNQYKLFVEETGQQLRFITWKRQNKFETKTKSKETTEK